MSINNSYFSRNNTIVSNNLVNTGRNPVMQLIYGDGGIADPVGYSRFIFDLDLALLIEKYADGTISTGCTNDITHTLKMTNTSYFDQELLNTFTPDGRKRATSFDLILFRIPYGDSDPNQPQFWDEGVGYDYYDYVEDQYNKAYSTRPSNWFQTTTLSGWTTPGIYNNLNSAIGTGINFSALTIVDIQHFEFGNENIEFDMTAEIDALLLGQIPNHVGWGIAYLPQVENLTGTDSSYSVAFFTRHTQTYYEPYLETNYDDLVQDDRNYFTLGKVNKLYLYIYDNGEPKNLDQLPLVTIKDQTGTAIPGLSGLTACTRTKGVYEITIPPLLGYSTPCIFTDTWSNLIINGFSIPNVINEFTVYPIKKTFQIGTETQDPQIYGFDYFGILQNEKILSSDMRKVGVIIKQAFTTNKMLPNVNAKYRVYVREGTTEVIVQDWTKISRSTNEYYFMFDTRDKIPNEYFIDLQVLVTGQITTYKKQIQFEIVNKKN